MTPSENIFFPSCSTWLRHASDCSSVEDAFGPGLYHSASINFLSVCWYFQCNKSRWPNIDLPLSWPSLTYQSPQPAYSPLHLQKSLILCCSSITPSLWWFSTPMLYLLTCSSFNSEVFPDWLPEAYRLMPCLPSTTSHILLVPTSAGAACVYIEYVYEA